MQMYFKGCIGAKILEAIGICELDSYTDCIRNMYDHLFIINPVKHSKVKRHKPCSLNNSYSI